MSSQGSGCRHIIAGIVVVTRERGAVGKWPIRDIEADDKYRKVVYPQIVDTARGGRRFITRVVPADQLLGADSVCFWARMPLAAPVGT
jgi:hypothetical protein